MAVIDSSTTIALLHFNESLVEDSSGHNVTFETSGDPRLVAQGKYNSAAYLDSTSQVLVNQDINILNNDFTIEAWFRFDSYPQNLANSSYLIAMGSDDDNVLFQFALRLNAANNGMSVLVNSGELHDQILTQVELEALGTDWFHMAFVYDKTLNTLTVYVNGTQKKVISDDQVGMTQLALFEDYQDSVNVNHYIDEFRISNVKRWTEDFETNTREYGMEDYDRLNYRNTKVLLHFNESITKDECQNIWGVNGIVSLVEDTDQFTKSFETLATNGTGVNYIQIQDKLALGMNDFTIDFFAKVDANIDKTVAGSPYIFELYNTTGHGENNADHDYIYLKSTGYGDNTAGFVLNYDGTSTVDEITLERGVNTHVALVFDATQRALRLYLDGVFVTSLTGLNFTDTANWILTIGDGYYTKATANAVSFSGRLDEFRVTVGKELWDREFTAPNTAYQIATEPLVTEDSDTVVFLSFDENAIKDDCGNQWKQIGGNLQLSNVKTKYGTSLYIGESLNFLRKKTALALGEEDFTIDFFVNNATTTADKYVFELYNTTSNDSIAFKTINGQSQFALAFNENETSNDIDIATGATLDHVAIIYDKSETSLDIYVNGQKKDGITGVTFTDTQNWQVNVANTHSPSVATNFFGYIEKFRIVTNTIKFEISNDEFTVGDTVLAVDGTRNPIRAAVSSTVFIPLKLY